MATEFGNTWRIKIGDGEAPEEFELIGGEGSFEWNRQSKEIDTASKDDGSYAPVGFGRQTITIPVNGKLRLPDAGLERVDAVAKTHPHEVMAQITKGAIVKYQGLVAIGNFSTAFPDDEACTFRFDMKAAAVPIIDDLGATT
ncbi:conserved hypothetical protein [Altererythrobacter sp. B11]|uniref:phage tail tube protein n=1 Tax=Altererythrobacter sp. B11 TaxID=2060312 RepID=UPI000DC73ECC|nr:phage tail tube protein [Altererythrobacter sp. B11]BBC72921.1 conserved hypothetical protein [Altererythrobacter sp. B11]